MSNGKIKVFSHVTAVMVLFILIMLAAWLHQKGIDGVTEKVMDEMQQEGRADAEPAFRYSID